MSSDQRHFVLGGLLIVVGLGIYANSIYNPFIFDDLRSIVDNGDIKRLWPPTWAPSENAQYPPVNSRPLVSFSLALNYAIGGLSVTGYHLFNLGVHLLSSIVLLSILWQLLRWKERLRPAGVRAEWIAVGSALVWMVHPLHSQTINYVVQRSELLVGLFYLLTIHFSILRFHAGSRFWSLAAVGACAAGMGSKEVMVTAPIMVLVLHRFFAAPTLRAALADCPKLYAGLSATWLILLALQWSDPHGSSIGLGGRVSPWIYALNQSWVVPHYLRLAIWPDPLVLDYGFPDTTLTLATAGPEAGLLLLMLAASLFGIWRRSSLGLLGLWFFLILAPTSSFVPIANEVAAERRVYLSLAAVSVLVVWMIYRGLGLLGSNHQTATGTRFRRHEILGGLVVLGVTSGLSYRTVVRNVEHQEEIAVWRSSVAAVPENPRAHNNLGVLLRSGGQLAEAIEQYRHALRLKPDYAEANYNLGNAMEMTADLEQAVYHYRQALKADPEYAKAHNNLGLVLKARGQLEEATGHYRRALRLRPGAAETHNNLAGALEAIGQADSAVIAYRRALEFRSDYAEAHQNLANLLKRTGRIQAAVGHYRQAIAIDSTFVEAHNNLGVVLGGQGERERAIHHFRRAVHFDPEYAKAHNNLGNLLKSAGEIASAIEHYEAALRIDPAFSEAHNNLGVAFGASRLSEASIHHFERAVELDSNYARARHNLGVALHIAGRLDEAIHQYEQALKIDPNLADARRTVEMARKQRK